MKKSFIVTYHVEGHYKTAVEIDVASEQITDEELDRIKELAQAELDEVDFGDLTYPDYYLQMIEEFNTGNVVWDKE